MRKPMTLRVILSQLTMGVLFASAALHSGLADVACAETIRGHYLEARTCQVYTGPCFANGEMGSAGKDAVMAWKIQQGEHDGVELDGLSVAMVVRASHTLGHAGFADAEKVDAMVIVDIDANERQQAALLDFVRMQSTPATAHVAEVRSAEIDLTLDLAELNGSLQVEDLVSLKARKARPGDCICSNESAFYPPLNPLAGAVPGVTLKGDVTARSLGTRWSIPDTRSAYLGIFERP